MKELKMTEIVMIENVMTIKSLNKEIRKMQLRSKTHT